MKRLTPRERLFENGTMFWFRDHILYRCTNYCSKRLLPPPPLLLLLLPPPLQFIGER